MKSVIAAGAMALTFSTVAARADEPSKFTAQVQPKLTSCKLIKTPTQLTAIGTSATTLAGSYCLANDIDLGAIPSWTPIGSTNIGGGGPFFTGQFYGNGHVIRNLKITVSSDGVFGLFSVVAGGLIQDVGVVDAKVSVTASTSAYVGALAGAVLQAAIATPVVSNVYSTGAVTCNDGMCAAGGLLGVTSNAVVQDAWSAAAANSNFAAGGLIGVIIGGNLGTYRRLYATGNVTGTSTALAIGGLSAGFTSGSGSVALEQAYATGTVKGSTSTAAGGLLGELTGSTNFVSGVYATGAVSGGGSALVGGLIGTLSDASLDQAFSTGKVSGGSSHGGLIGQSTGTPTITHAYWDKSTSGQAASAGGSEVGKTTTQLRNALPGGFAGAWGITRTLSYPYLNLPGNFSSTLATLVLSGKIFAFLPIQQSDMGQYIGNPSHTDQASLATVYTMIARAVGITDNVSTLTNVKIDKYFWHDSTQTTTFAGPLTNHAVLGTMTTIAAGTKLTTANVIGSMNAHQLVILRGTYTKSGGGTATHYMLGTLYTKTGTAVNTVVANDPWTGTQVEISPTTKKVVTPGFPLANFTVNGYQPVTTLH